MTLKTDSELNIDLSIDFPGNPAMQGVLAKATVLSYIRGYPNLRCLVLAIKSLLAKHDLNKTYTGGLNSYSVVLWVVAFLQSNLMEQDLGKQLNGFLQFYGETFDP